MTTALLRTRLTLPEALMAFLHNKDGQAYQSARPDALTAAAELGELALAGHVHLEGDRFSAVSPAPSAPGRAWMAELTAALPPQPVPIRDWIRKRRTALATQQVEALAQGVLTKDRAKLFGVFGYDRHRVDPALRAALLAELDGPAARSVPRAQALARLLTSSALHRHLDLDDTRRHRLEQLAEDRSDTPLPGPLFTAMDVAIASAVAPSVLGE
ncbi:GPP34 family phosphoprotein [Nocardioides pantholopis]|uniref:GPP34 family phosphoprotein n=1 Tax=Nocardioides pantholopis TaxID=2483798 RepID=UPI000F096F01|nr:GPP34 family phosphoprotein [Nocardioides pantholopis]